MDNDNQFTLLTQRHTTQGAHDMTTLFGGSLHSALVHAVTRYDERQSKGKRYNHYALAQYLKRVDDICQDVKRGAPIRSAIVAGMTGSLLSACLKAASEAPATRDELSGFGKGWAYQPHA
jgi:hypothetical protein